MDRDQLEARAERCLRRGELAEAVALYEAMVATFPGDGAVERKLAELKSQLEPSELHGPEARAEGDSLEARAEQLWAEGDLAGAIGVYRRALAEKPDNELIQERLAELFRLARPPHDSAAVLRALLERIAERRR